VRFSNLPLFSVIILLVANFNQIPSVWTPETPTREHRAFAENHLAAKIDDVTLLDVYKGLADEEHPLYYGHVQLFYGEKLFYYQKGGVHNWALVHISFNETVWIESITNCEFINNQVIVHQNETWIELSNGTAWWKPCLTCPICGNLTHAAEFSHNSLALYYFCDECRVVIGEDLGHPNKTI